MRNKILELLDEISFACRKEDIPFFLSEEFAFRLYKGQPIGDKFCDAAVMIFAADAKRLEHALLETNKTRVIESLDNNKNFPGFYLRYMDPQTTMLYYGDERITYKTNAIGIDIELICGVCGNGWKNKLLNRLKSAYCQRFRAAYIQPGDTGWNTKPGIARVLLPFFHTSKGMRKLFRAWIRQGTKVKKDLTAVLNNGRQIQFKASLVRHSEEKEIEGKTYPVVKELQKFIKKLYPRTPKIRLFSEYIFDTMVPWEQYREALEGESLNVRNSRRERRRYLQWRAKNYLPMLNKRTYYYNIAFCSGERVRLWKKYGKDKLSRIQRLYSEENYSKLKDEMADYLDALRYYAKQKIGLCFNPELLEIGIKLLVMEETENAVSQKTYERKSAKWLKLVSGIPYQHFDEIENSFWGKGTEPDVLKERKQKCHERLLQFCGEYYQERKKEAEPI